MEAEIARRPCAVVLAGVLAVALACLTALGADPPQDPFQEARDLLNAGRSDDVVESVTRVLEAHDGDGALYTAASQLMREAFRPAPALQAARKAVELRPQDPNAQRQLARCLLDAARTIEDSEARRTAEDHALAVFGEAASVAPDPTEYLVEWAETLARLDRHEAAVPVWERAIERDRGLAAAQIGLARSLVKLDRWDELRHRATEAQDTDPAFAWRFALTAYDKAATDRKYEIADSFLPVLRKTGRGDSQVRGVMALESVTLRPYARTLRDLASYLATKPDGEESEIICSAVMDRGIGEIKPPRRLPKRKTPPGPPGDVALPKLVRKVEPVYPSEFEGRGIEGKVILQTVVRTDGSIGRMQVLHSTHPNFSVAALDAVKRWHYLPAVQDGRPVAIYYTIRVDFRSK